MEINIEWLNACNNFRSAIKRSQELLEEMEKPYLTDLGLVPEIHAMLSEYLSTQEPYVAIRAEVLILVYLYEPARLARQQKASCNTIESITTFERSSMRVFAG